MLLIIYYIELHFLDVTHNFSLPTIYNQSNLRVFHISDHISAAVFGARKLFAADFIFAVALSVNIFSDVSHIRTLRDNLNLHTCDV